MPLYEYECSACHKRTEKIQKFSDPELTECPFCGGKLERVLSAPAVSFKGGGWYADLYSSSKSGGSSSNGTAASASKSSDSSTPSATSNTPSSAPAASTSTSSDKK